MLYQEAITLKKSYHFPNVTSLTLESELDLEDIDDHPLQIEHIHILKMIVNLSNLKHLTISLASEIKSSSVLLQLLKETSQLSSISIELQHLQSFFNDDELCKYLNQMITRLDVHRYRFPYKSFDNAEKIKQFCKIFSNLEQLICHINQENDLLLLLIHLPKLSIMEIRLSTLVGCKRFIYWLEDEAQKLNLIIHTEFENNISQILYIWIDRYQRFH